MRMLTSEWTCGMPRLLFLLFFLFYGISFVHWFLFMCHKPCYAILCAHEFPLSPFFISLACASLMWLSLICFGDTIASFGFVLSFIPFYAAPNYRKSVVIFDCKSSSASVYESLCERTRNGSHLIVQVINSFVFFFAICFFCDFMNDFCFIKKN